MYFIKILKMNYNYNYKSPDYKMELVRIVDSIEHHATFALSSTLQRGSLKAKWRL